MADPNVYTVEFPCSDCGGSGRLVLDDRHPEDWHECPTCHGHGVKEQGFRGAGPWWKDRPV